MSNQPTDNELISLCLRGNSAAYAGLVERYQNLVFSVVIRYVKEREDAEEVAQDVFVKAYRALPDYKGTAKFSTWLYTIATTTCLSFLRKKRPNVQSLDDSEGRTVHQISGGMGADVVEQKSRQGMVNTAMALLNPDDAQVLTLFYKGDQTLEEIGAVMGKEPNAVKVQLHRARTRLKEKMVQYFGAEVKDIY